jgi:hypothetical protein
MSLMSFGFPVERHLCEGIASGQQMCSFARNVNVTITIPGCRREKARIVAYERYRSYSGLGLRCLINLVDTELRRSVTLAFQDRE